MEVNSFAMLDHNILAYVDERDRKRNPCKLLKIAQKLSKEIQQEDLAQKKVFAYTYLAAEKGHPNALFLTAMCYYTGEGIQKNEQKYRNFLIQAAEKGDHAAIQQLGLNYQHGYDGFPKDQQKAFTIYQEAVNKGYFYFLDYLQTCYFKGFGVTPNYWLAAECLQQSINKVEDSEADGTLARRYQNGEGVPLDYAKCISYLKKVDSRTGLHLADRTFMDLEYN